MSEQKLNEMMIDIAQPPIYYHYGLVYTKHVLYVRIY